MSTVPERVGSVSFEVAASQSVGGPAANSLPLVLGSVLVVAFSALFARPWWNRYLGLTNEGWYQFFGSQIVQGRIPYRDFHLFVPPGQALVMAALTAIFGPRLIVAEVFGFIGIVVISLALYVWLTRLFPSFWVTVAVVATAAVYLRYNSESLSGMHVDVNLCAALAMLCASFALSGRPATILLAGMVAGITFVTKQTAGVAITASIGATLPVLLARRSDTGVGVRSAVWFSAGWSIPVALVSIWLAAHGAFWAFLNAIFLRGPSSKGSTTGLLTREIATMLGDHRYMFITFLALTLVAGFGICTRLRQTKVTRQRGTWSLLAFGLAALVVLLWAQHVHNFTQPASRLDLLVQILPLYVGHLGSLAILAVYGWRFAHGHLNAWEEQILLAAAVCALFAYVMSFSLGDARTMLIPAFPFVVAFGLSQLSSSRVVPVLRTATISVVLLCIAVTTSVKIQRPYSWNDWMEGSVFRANTRMAFPELEGIRVTPETAAFITRVVDDIREHSKPSDPIAELSGMPVLYLLSHRSPATLGYVHFIDVTPDDVYVRDAETLREHPPAVIVFMDYDEAKLREGEINWRNGRRSGERVLASAVESLRNQYKFIDVLQIPRTGGQLEVWGRQ
jgi:hypothetical protein